MRLFSDVAAAAQVVRDDARESRHGCKPAAPAPSRIDPE
jgi:hypothetical protein